jgi:hypothetical protein
MRHRPRPEQADAMTGIHAGLIANLAELIDGADT